MDTNSPSEPLTVYWASGSPTAWPVQLALVEKALPHQSIRITFSSGDNRTPEFLRMNPRGKVPVLRHGNRAVFESGAIVDYLEEHFPAPSLIPSDIDARALDMIRKQETAYIYPAADRAISYTSYSSTLRREDWDIAKLREISQPLVDEFMRWDGYLEGRDWLTASSRPTQSDLFLIPLLLYMYRFGFDYAARGMPNLAAYRLRAIALESVARTWPPHWLEQPGDPTFALAITTA